MEGELVLVVVFLDDSEDVLELFGNVFWMIIGFVMVVVLVIGIVVGLFV